MLTTAVEFVTEQPLCVVLRCERSRGKEEDMHETEKCIDRGEGHRALPSVLALTNKQQFRGRISANPGFFA